MALVANAISIYVARSYLNFGAPLRKRVGGGGSSTKSYFGQDLISYHAFRKEKQLFETCFLIKKKLLFEKLFSLVPRIFKFLRPKIKVSGGLDIFITIQGSSQNIT